MKDMNNIIKKIREFHSKQHCYCSEKCEFIESVKRMLEYDSLEDQMKDIEDGYICICGNILFIKSKDR